MDEKMLPYLIGAGAIGVVLFMVVGGRGGGQAQVIDVGGEDSGRDELRMKALGLAITREEREVMLGERRADRELERERLKYELELERERRRGEREERQAARELERERFKKEQALLQQREENERRAREQAELARAEETRRESEQRELESRRQHEISWWSTLGGIVTGILSGIAVLSDEELYRARRTWASANAGQLYMLSASYRRRGGE